MNNDTVKILRVYYAHAICLYGTEQEKKELVLIREKFEDAEIINPVNYQDRSMDSYKDYAKRLPIKEVKNQKEIIEIVKSIIEHFKKSSRVSPNYQSYKTENVVKHRKFSEYYVKINPTDRDPKDIETSGRIEKLVVKEFVDWLSFKVEYIDKDQKKIIDHEILRCRIKDRNVRTYLLNELNKSPSNLGNRLFDKVLNTTIPAFHKDYGEDIKLIKKQMNPYLNDYDANQKWNKEYVEYDKQLNKKVFKIYDLNNEEIQIVEENSRRTGWHGELQSV